MGIDGGRNVTGSIRAEALCAPSHLDSEAAAEARRVVCARFNAWNRGDVVAIRALMHMPHVSMPGPRPIICETESASADPRGVATADGWHHSKLERLDVSQWSADKVHCAIAFGKNAATGRRYADAEAVYVVTRAAGRWGILLNSVTMSPIGVGDGDHAPAETVALSLFQRWLVARDAGDVAAMRQLVHLPFVELRGTRLVVHKTMTSLRRDAADAAQDSARPLRVIRRVKVRERSPHKVTLEAAVARVGPDGAAPALETALVIATRLQGRWAIQVLSAF